jgi:signal transduction histidine kinase
VVLGKAGGFTQDDEDILALFASSAAVALSNSMLFEKTLELERLKSDFVAVVSHELRTPLAVVIGNLELLSDDRFWKLEPQQAKFLTAAVDQFQPPAPPDQRHPRLLEARERVAADDALAERAGRGHPPGGENLRRLFEEREINLDISIADDLPLAEIDEQRIAQVLTNLISNAIKFSPAGAPVEVSCRTTAPSRRCGCAIAARASAARTCRSCSRSSRSSIRSRRARRAAPALDSRSRAA